MKSFRTFTNWAALALSVGNSAGVFENFVIGLKFTKAGNYWFEVHQELLAENPCKNAKENKLVGKKPPVFHSAFFQEYQDPVQMEEISSQDADYVCGKTEPYFREDLKRICDRASFQMIQNIRDRTIKDTDCVDPLTREKYDTKEVFSIFFPEGVYRRLQEDGATVTTTFVAGRLQEVQEFPDSGEKISQQYRNGVKDGVRVTFAGGRTETSEWKEGKIQNGRYSETSFDGSFATQDWENGQMHGQRKTVSRDGTMITETEWKNGKLDGVGIAKNEKGEILSRVQYRNGKMDGVRRITMDGRTATSEWKEGLQHGLEVHETDDGLVHEIRWENGKKIDERDRPSVESGDESGDSSDSSSDSSSSEASESG